jgi:type IV pilus assembly protein PilB
MKVVSDKGIEDILSEQGKLDGDKLSLVKIESINTGRPVESILLEHNFVSEEDLMKARAELLGIPYINLGDKPIPSEILNLVPEPVARRYSLIPFYLDQETKTLSVGMVDPLDLQVIEFIERKSGHKVKPYLTLAEDVNRCIENQYSQSLATEVTAVLKETGGMVEAQESISDLGKVQEEVIRESSTAKIVSTLVEYAIKGRASDIHIEPLEDKTRVRYRIDGILQERVVLPRGVNEALVSRIKILSSLKIDEKRVPQDGRFTFKMSDQVVDLRVSTLPTVHGEKVVMRLLPKSGAVPTLSDLGMRGTALKSVEREILKPYGIILVTGPTGSGKTTTLFAILSKINSPRVNIVTLEDPVEYRIPGVNQVQINPAAGLTFASGLRSFLRQDPNVIMVGEIRDSETTGLAVQAALTGHLVFSTLHTNTAAGALPRLLDMGAESYLLASSMNLVIAQRVCRRICDSCKESFTPAEPVVADIRKVLNSFLRCDGEKCEICLEKECEHKKLSLDGHSKSGKIAHLKLYKGKGCDACGGTGYSGRMGIFEVIPVTEKIGRLVLEKAPAVEIEKAAMADGMVTMKEDGYLKVLEGATTIEEVLRVAQD